MRGIIASMAVITVCALMVFLSGMVIGRHSPPRGFTCTDRIVETGECTAYVKAPQ